VKKATVTIATPLWMEYHCSFCGQKQSSVVCLSTQ